MVRGDIVSNTGYAHAARALASILAESGPVYGVSIHVDPSDCDQAFPGGLVAAQALPDLARERVLVVVHHTTPDHFMPVPGAINVGSFYWETAAIPYRYQWPEYIAAMDAIWAPTRFIADFTRATGYRGPLSVVPWSHDFDAPAQSIARPGRLSQVQATYLDRMPDPGSAAVQDVRLTDLLDRGGRTFLSVQSLSPRKGLPVLVAEWCRFVAETRQDCRLILKLSFRHALGVGADHGAHFVSLLLQLGVRPGQRIAMALIDADLPRADLEDLVARADCLVSATYGEGFGGPIVEALVHDTAVICPRHTGITDLLPADYALRIEHEPMRVQLRGLPDVYPASATWNVPRAGSLNDALQRFCDLPPQHVAAVKAAARRTAERFCSLPAGRAAVDSALRQILEIR